MADNTRDHSIKKNLFRPKLLLPYKKKTYLTQTKSKITFYRDSSLVLLLLAGRVPGEALLVELDDGLGTLDVGLPGGHQVGLVAALPLDQEHELAGRVSGT